MVFTGVTARNLRIRGAGGGDPEAAGRGAINAVQILDDQISADGDEDNDGLLNAWELTYRFNPSSGVGDDGADGDPDGDTLSNLVEQELGTNPIIADSDNDTLRDDVETNTGVFVDVTDTGTDPLNPDTDDDGFPDATERNTGTYVDATDPGTDPNNPDSDGDFFSDFQEVELQTDPTDAASTPVFPAPVAFWSFDDQGGLTTADVTGNNNTGTVVGAPNYVAGHSGSVGDYAMNFDGVDDGVTTPVSLSGLSDYTLAGWVRSPSVQSGFSGLFGQNDVLEFGFDQPEGILFWSTPGGAIIVSAGPSDEWRHIAITGNRTKRVLYIDGEIQGEGLLGSPLASSGFTVSIGGGGIFGPTGDFFLGEMNDVGIWHTALSQVTIQALVSGVISANPNIGDTPLAILSFERPGGNQINFSITGTVAGVNYAIDESGSLQDGSWNELTDFEGDDGEQRVTAFLIPSDPPAVQKFFRVRVMIDE